MAHYLCAIYIAVYLSAICITYAPTENSLLHFTAFKAVCKAFHNGPLVSAGEAHTHTHTHTRREKSPTVFGRPRGGRGRACK